MGSKQIFRKKSIERVSSPEQLDDYIRVASPSVWLILAAIILLLAGGVIWGIFGQIEVDTESGTQTVAPITYILE